MKQYVYLFAWALMGVVGCQNRLGFDAAESPIQGQWRIVAIDHQDVIEPATLILEFHPDNQVSGSTGCNQVSGRYVSSGVAIHFLQLASTRRMCDAVLMDQERAVLGALSAVTTIRHDTQAQVYLHGSELHSLTLRRVLD